MSLGLFYLDQGRRTEAAIMADRADKLCADNSCPGYPAFLSPVFSDLAKLHVGLGDLSKGEELYIRIAALRRTVPFNRNISKAEEGLADLYTAQGRLTEAEDLYRRAIRVQEHLSEWEWASLLYDKLAVAYEKEGKRREADQARVKSKALRPGS